VVDNPDDADVSVSMLEELGYRVLTVGDAASALEAIGKETFDLVVSDIIMAGSMDGLAMARTIRGRQPGLPVLLVTGYSHVANEAQADFIVIRKPFKLPELSRTTARMIAESKQPAITNVVRLRDVRDGGASRTKPR
jgi:CheY-like chemotaxis protein